MTDAERDAVIRVILGELTCWCDGCIRPLKWRLDHALPDVRWYDSPEWPK